jgi:hypothetical protein
MYPIGSNGASQAILDARVITREILAKGATNAALVAYEAERRPANHRSRDAQPPQRTEQVMQMVEERAPDGYDVVTDVLSLQELEISPPTTSASPASRSRGSTPSRRSSSSRGRPRAPPASRSDDGPRRLDQPRAGRRPQQLRVAPANRAVRRVEARFTRRTTGRLRLVQPCRFTRDLTRSH